MKQFLLLLLLATGMCAQAQIKVVENPGLSKSEIKNSAVAIRRLANFYDWYLKYLKASHGERPVSHVILDQNVTNKLKQQVKSNQSAKDDFFDQANVDTNCVITLMVVQVDKAHVGVKATIAGKTNYTMMIDMLIQKEAWCIDAVTSQTQAAKEEK